MAAPPVDPTALVVIAVKNKEIRLHTNSAGLRMLSSWMLWLSECPNDENWEAHIAWRLNANAGDRGNQFGIVRHGPDLDTFFDPEEDTSDDEFTVMVVETNELRAILRRIPA
jgi:hypothetical protein